MATRVGVTMILVTLAAIRVTAQDQSQTQGGRIGFGPQVGIYKSRDADAVRVMGGVALRLKLSDALGVEGSINYREEKYAAGFVDVKSWPVMVTGLLYPVPPIYGAIGAGWYNTTIEYNFPQGFLGGPVSLANETKQQFGWHFGGGVELPLGSVGKLVGDIRYVFLDYKFKDFPGSNGVNSNFYIISAGLLFGL
jgi:opacity protein-like surface antigen